jgi:hypothetical protein
MTATAYAKLKKQKDQLVKKMATLVKPSLKKEAEAFFKKYPDADSFSWTQYAPYFNDGEPCTFGVNTDPSYDIKINDVKFEDEEDGDSSADDHPKLPEEAYEMVASIVNGFDQDDLEELCSDGEVVVRRNGKIEFEDYSHD